MKIGIIGLPNSGKKTLFRLLTGVNIAANTEQKSVPGIAEIRDSRFAYLSNLYNPKKNASAQISMDLMPDLDKRVIQEGSIFKDIANLDAICFVVRSFTDESVYHVSGSVNPERDIEEIMSELILHDLLFIEKRMERLEKNLKKPGADQYKKEEALLLIFKQHLEKDMPLRTCEISEDDKKIILSYPFITLKELIIALNAVDNELSDETVKNKLSEKYASHKISIMQISAKLEAEIQALESDEERAEFMSASGISESAVNQLSRLCMEALGLISFFTVGEDEVKQWLIRKGSLAPEAAGAIHSDIERGFIRAEVMKYDEFTVYGSEEKLKQAGKYYVMGKDYTVGDGDIISFRFNV
ncbi:MAG: redox-regulated ATPase YchF [Spirochaetes bacterium]|nr:redox-regulated ATPase YchF [Spirochaetota bacterium]